MSFKKDSSLKFACGGSNFEIGLVTSAILTELQGISVTLHMTIPSVVRSWPMLELISKEPLRL